MTIRNSFFLSFFLFIILSINVSASKLSHSQVLKIYTSHGYLPSSLIEKFEQETGIMILIDVFDNDDALESKMLSGASGYDLVFPTAWPYAVRQVAAGFYQKLDTNKLPILKTLDPFFIKSLSATHQAQTYLIPYLWGVVGFAYNVEEVNKNLENPPLDSWAMFFNLEFVKKMSLCGVALLDDPTDVIIAAKLYLGLDPVQESKEDLQKVIHLLQKIRPFIKRFDISRSNDEIANGEMCLVQQWMGAVVSSYAHLGSSEKRPQIELVVPKEGTLMWLDVMAIPSTAENLEAAYCFINFILKPENIAQVTNSTYYANPVEASYPFIDNEIRTNKAIYPDHEVRKRIVLHKSFSPSYLKQMTRSLMKIRSGY